MKKTILISLLVIAAMDIHAQSANRPTINNDVCKSFPNMPANAVPAWPKTAYTPLEDPKCPPCYEYVSQHGTLRMECFYLQFPPERVTPTGVREVTLQKDVDLYPQPDANRYPPVNVQSSNTSTEKTYNENTSANTEKIYTGNYPAVCKRFPDMPANGHPVWPKGTYTPLQDPSCPPCYEYVSKHGTLRMECPYLQFPPEHPRQ